jgi:sugar phosphate isomerase/epimerase
VKSALVALLPLVLVASATAKEPLFSAVGMAGPLDKAAELKAAGAEFLTLGVGDLLVPDKSDAEFEKRLAKAKGSPLPVMACNGFIRPKNLRCVGEEANHDEVLVWADTTFRRAKQAGAKFIVFGSGGSRRLKDGWPKDKADEQFVALLKRMGPLARAQGITVVVEQLNERECNYLTTIGETAEVVRKAGDPNVRLLADLYHMAMMGDTPADLDKAMDVVVHVEIAEKEGRSVPGVNGVDFRPFFEVLKKHGYHGAISIEGKWKIEQLPKAFATIREQAG